MALTCGTRKPTQPPPLETHSFSCRSARRPRRVLEKEKPGGVQPHGVLLGVERRTCQQTRAVRRGPDQRPRRRLRTTQARRNAPRCPRDKEDGGCLRQGGFASAETRGTERAGCAAAVPCCCPLAW